MQAITINGTNLSYTGLLVISCFVSSFFLLTCGLSDLSEQVEYPDDFEEVEVEEEYEDEAPRRPHEDVQEEEFQLCDAGGLTITLKALKEKG